MVFINTYEALIVMLTFGILIIAMLTFITSIMFFLSRKKQ
ncbi:putative holin-like toxin [Paenibacillus amylolyticus]